MSVKQGKHSNNKAINQLFFLATTSVSGNRKNEYSVSSYGKREKLNILFFSYFLSFKGANGRDAPLKEIKVNNDRRFVAVFNVVNTTKRDAGNYRCMIRTEGGVAVSNYAELVVKGTSPFSVYVIFSCFL